MKRLFLLAALLASSASAAVDSTLFQELQWRSLGPFRGGRVLAVTGVRGEPEHFYFGSVNGGVWETNDAGRTWRAIFDDQPIGSIGAIAVAESNPRVIYAGSGEADMRSDIAQGNGIYKSVDAGRTWSQSGLTDSQQIGRVIIHPQNPDLVYVAALGHPYGPNSERGVFRTRDGGQSWQKVLGRAASREAPAAEQGPDWDSETGAIDVAFEPGNPSVIYAALWQTRRTPWSVYPPSNGPGSGLFKSTDGGDHWAELRGHGFPDRPGRIGLAVAPSQPQRVYAIVDAADGGMYRSDDGGSNWTRTSADSRIWTRGWYFGGVTVEPKNADVVYSLNINLYRSTDGGKVWTPVKGAPGGDDYHQLWIDPGHPERRILGVDQGAVVSLNEGRTWSSWFNQPTGQFYHVSTDNRFPYWVYGAQQDSGAAGLPSRTNLFDGITLAQFREITAGGESDNIAPDPRDPEIIYGGSVERLDTRTGQTVQIDPTLAYPDNYRRTWTLPLVFSPRDPKILYFANQRMFRTEDGGNHWSVISPDLTRENPAIPANLDPVTAQNKPGKGTRFGVVYAIAPSRLKDGQIWAGTDDGQIWRTLDEGSHWNNVTPRELTPWSKVGVIEASHFEAESAYAAVDRHRLDDFRPYIYRTRDGGRSWQLIVDGLPIFVNVVRQDPVQRGLLYAGTERGMYVSFDDGDHWQTLQRNLPVTSVRDIDVHGDDLVIATHGRGFWILDDVSPLRQATEVQTGQPFLYQPSVAVRFRPAGFTGSPMPKDEPLAENPPLGAYIDYVVPAAVGEITLEIFDSGDRLVRHYSSNDRVPSADPAKLRVAPEWFNPPSSLKTTPGMHRFVWPLRYGLPAALDDAHRGPFADGLWAPPGHYRILLTVGSQKRTRKLTIASDPRIKMSLQAYVEQWELGRRIEATRAAVHAALAEAEELARKVEEPARSRVTEFAEIVTEGMWHLAPQTTTSLRFVDGALQKLAAAVDSADTPPSADLREGYALLGPMAERALQRWKEFKAAVR